MLVRLTRNRLHYGWIVAAATFLALLCSAGIRSMPGVLIVPLEKHFGWSRATISAAVSINLLLYGLCGPFAAAFMERFGLRRVVLAAMVCVAVAVLLTTQMHAAWQLDLLWGGFVGAGTGAVASVLGAVVANRWFVKRRGLVMGILTASGATGQLIFLPLLASLVVTFGWRAAALTVSLVAIAALPLLALLLRDRPADLGLRPFGAEGELEEPPAVPGNPLSAPLRALGRGLHSGDFWLLAVSFFICGATTNGLIGTHLIPAVMEHGVPEVTAASLLAMIGVFDLLGTTVSGWLSDRIDNRWLLCWYYSLRGLSLLFLPYALGSSFVGLAAFVVFYGLDWVATVPPTVRLTADSFGAQNVGMMFGWILAAHQLGAALAAFGAGAMHTWLGDYQVAFMSAGLLCLVAAGTVLRIGRTGGEPGPAEPALRLAPEASAGS